MKLRVDAQFVRFLFTEQLGPLNLNKIKADRKEPKMQTKGQM
jgi:hypothetical protein